MRKDFQQKPSTFLSHNFHQATLHYAVSALPRESACSCTKGCLAFCIIIATITLNGVPSFLPNGKSFCSKKTISECMQSSWYIEYYTHDINHRIERLTLLTVESKLTAVCILYCAAVPFIWSWVDTL